MESYGDFAYVYDELMDETPYEEWADMIAGLIEKYGVTRPVRGLTDPLESEKNLVVDLGCGTGTLTQLLHDKGYDMTGIDCSEEMLNVAIEKKEKSGADILYLKQDMRELELYSTVGTVISVCDSLNYLLHEEELLQVFKLVNNYLYPGGIFIFDFNTVYKYAQVIGDATIAENREDCSFIWENYYDPDTEVNEYDLTVFVRDKMCGQIESFRRFTETHLQRGYTLDQMTGLVREAGMSIVLTIDADTHGSVTPESERIYIVAGECGKTVTVPENESSYGSANCS